MESAQDNLCWRLSQLKQVKGSSCHQQIFVQWINMCRITHDCQILNFEFKEKTQNSTKLNSQTQATENFASDMQH